ncbi:response regulator transcription factor [Ruminiclostridium cellobioparum]|uniref:Stage 0 sporulation protein A homolog n=1 Tax=Ruminiclostridium cellobioparum subsp. termitidis CT1112 TaxID=1195236 RepID=S0FIM5_RUMCE|nr:response regulator transcription factor [Ruminiclostridium cellobioparum]EMS71547.1 two component transcriptional regulator, winged helix family protein [Ruminiclostridium cellobioparum subsp. termitidis CT1112]
MRKKMILLVEDNEQILRGNERLLTRRGYGIAAALTLFEARKELETQMPDLIVLDIMLPDGSGLDFIAELRQHSQIPVLLLTGLTTPEDVVRGLTAGGDDYLAKPYDFGVLLARVEALLRRSEQIPEKLTRDRLSLDVTVGVALLDGTDLLLTQKEFALLLLFAQNVGRFIGAEYLYEKVWKQPMTGDSNALRSTLKRLRAKLEGSGYCIILSKGEGYQFERE